MQKESPPNQHYVKKFIYYAALGVPHVDIQKYRLKVSGLVENPLEFTTESLALQDGDDNRKFIKRIC